MGLKIIKKPHAFPTTGNRPGLERMRFLLRGLCNPQNARTICPRRRLIASLRAGSLNFAITVCKAFVVAHEAALVRPSAAFSFSSVASKSKKSGNTRFNSDKELIYLAVLAYSSVFQKRSSDIRRTFLHLKTESCLILFVINNIHSIIYIFNQSGPFISQLLI